MNKIKGWLVNNFLNFAGKKILPGILVVFLSLLTVGTSLAGMGKIVSTFSSERSKQANISGGEVQGVFTSEQMADDSIAADGSIVQGGSSDVLGVQDSAGVSQGSNQTLSPTVTLKPTATIAPSSSSNNNSCIITLFGKQYNITNLLTSHSGGNVFACGTDMSTSYQNRHGTNVGMMQGYLIGGGSSSAPTSTPTLAPTPTPIPNNNNNSGSPTPTSAPTPTAGGSCLITLFNKQYNITSLLVTHSGGNVFTCGTDMSTVYQGRHGTNVSIMQAYLIASGVTPTPTPTRTPTSTPTPTRAPTPTPTRTPTPTPIRTPTPTPTRTPTPTPTRTPSGAPTPTPTRIPTPTPTRIPTPTPTRTPTPTPTSVPTPTLTPTPSGCIVTLFGRRYEITSLLSSHSGGNVFTCGADMSAVYQGRHGTNVNMMQRYLIP